LLSQEIGHASRGSNDIPTRLAPRRTPILYRQSQKILLKKRGKSTRGGTRPKPSKYKEKTAKKENKNTDHLHIII